MRRLLQAAAAAAVAMGVCAQALAQDYPNRSIALIVPYPPGGCVHAMGRVVAEKLSVALGQQVVVDNRAGGSALVGTRALVKSPADGYTLFLGHTGSLAINPNLYANAGFDPRKDFAPIGLIASMPVVLLAHPRSLRRRSAKSLPSRSKREPISISAHRQPALAAISLPNCSSRSPASTLRSSLSRARRSSRTISSAITCRLPSACCRRPSAICRPVRCARSQFLAPPGSASCPTYRPQTSRACRDSNRFCTMARSAQPVGRCAHRSGERAVVNDRQHPKLLRKQRSRPRARPWREDASATQL